MSKAGIRSLRLAVLLVTAGTLAFNTPAVASTVVTAGHGKVVVPASRGHKAPVLDVVMTGDGFSLPNSVHAGFVTFRVSTPDATYHALQGLSVNKGHTIDQVIADFQLGLSDDRLQNAEGARNLVRDAVLVGGVVATSYAPQAVTIPLTAGTYYFFDQNDVGLPGTAAPRLHVLRVHGGMKWAGFPTFSSVIGMSMTDDMPMFNAPSSFDAQGATLIYNNSDEIHEAVWRPLKDGITDAYISNYYAAIDGGLPRPPSPWTGPQRGLQAMSPGRFAVLRLDLPAGLNALLCLVPDDTTGIAHSHMGMFKVVTLD